MKSLSKGTILYETAHHKVKIFINNILDDPIDRLALPIAEFLLILFIGIVAIKLSNRLIDKFFSIRSMDTNRANTLRTLIKSAVGYATYFLFILVILLKLGFDPMPILAGAGIFGLAIGFGAQNLVKDFITGFFLIFERQLEVGDTVQINGQINGIVEEVGLRTTKIREYTQRLHYIPNGRIIQVTNYNREQMRAVIHVTVPYESDMDRVTRTLEEVCNHIKEQHKSVLIEEPILSGVTSITAQGIQFTITALAKPEDYSSLEGEIRKETVLHLQKNDIQFAYPRSILHNAEQ